MTLTNTKTPEFRVYGTSNDSRNGDTLSGMIYALITPSSTESKQLRQKVIPV